MGVERHIRIKLAEGEWRLEGRKEQRERLKEDKKNGAGDRKSRTKCVLTKGAASQEKVNGP